MERPVTIPTANSVRISTAMWVMTAERDTMLTITAEETVTIVAVLDMMPTEMQPTSIPDRLTAKAKERKATDTATARRRMQMLTAKENIMTLPNMAPDNNMAVMVTTEESNTVKLVMVTATNMAVQAMLTAKHTEEQVTIPAITTVVMPMTGIVHTILQNIRVIRIPMLRVPPPEISTAKMIPLTVKIIEGTNTPQPMLMVLINMARTPRPIKVRTVPMGVNMVRTPITLTGNSSSPTINDGTVRAPLPFKLDKGRQRKKNGKDSKVDNSGFQTLGSGDNTSRDLDSTYSNFSNGARKNVREDAILDETEIEEESYETNKEVEDNTYLSKTTISESVYSYNRTYVIETRKTKTNVEESASADKELYDKTSANSSSSKTEQTKYINKPNLINYPSPRREIS